MHELKGWRKNNPWLAWFEISRDDAEAEFFGGWDAIRYVVGDTPLEAALERAQRIPLRLAPEISESRPDGYARFIALAGWLQVLMGDHNILLPVQQVGELLNCNKATVGRYCRWAIEDGYLALVAKAERNPHGRGKAARYRFNVSRFPTLKECAQKGTQESFEIAEKR
jgi:hypothetical protein